MLEHEKRFIVEVLKGHGNKSIKKVPKAPAMFKDNEESGKMRNKANELLKKKNHTATEHKIIFSLYSKSIALAPEESEELAYAYGNRAALLMHIGKYQEVTADIARALLAIPFDYFSQWAAYKVKLYCRMFRAMLFCKSECKSASLVLDCLLRNIPDSHKDKKASIEMVQKLKLEIAKKTITSGTEDKETLVDKVKQVKIDKSEEEDSASTDLTLDEKIVDNFESVAVKHSKKFGRYLVATRDIQPGEIIYSEKFYAACLYPGKQFTNCHHCFKSCWTMIPCDYCPLAMFCSRECKVEAFKNYHEFECGPTSLMEMANEKTYYQYSLSLRLLIVAVKEAGSVENLRKKLQAMDLKIDKNSDGFVKDQKIEKLFSSVYKLQSNVDRDDEKIYATASAEILLFLIESTLMFNDNTETVILSNVKNNEDYVFVGALLLKICKINHLNDYRLLKPTEFCDHSEQEFEHAKNFCMSSGRGLALISSLLNSSCDPNVSKDYTNDLNQIVFALEPIEKGSQLFCSYGPAFYDNTKEERLDWQKNYNYACACKACKNNWPELLNCTPYSKIETVDKDPIKQKLKAKFAKEIQKIEKLVLSDFSQISKEQWIQIKEDLGKSIMEASKHFSQPSNIISYFKSLMVLAFSKINDLERLEFNAC